MEIEAEITHENNSLVVFRSLENVDCLACGLKMDRFMHVLLCFIRSRLCLDSVSWP